MSFKVMYVSRRFETNICATIHLKALQELFGDDLFVVDLRTELVYSETENRLNLGKLSVAEKIKTAREKAGLTQAQLAEKVGTTSQNISQYERGIRNPKYNTLEKIAHALGVNVDSFHKNLFDLSAPDDPRRTMHIRSKLLFTGHDIGFDEENAYLWIRYPNGTLLITERELQELDVLTDDFLTFELERLKQRKIDDFFPDKK